MTTEDMPFESAITELFSADPLPIQFVYRLSDISDENMADFQEKWAEVDPDRRVAISRHMADIAEDDYVVEFSPMFRYLLDDPTPEVRQAALDGLWDSSDRLLIGPIVEMLENDPSPGVQATAARALSHFILLAEWGQLETKYVQPAMNSLMKAYQSPEEPENVRRAALEAMASAGGPQIAKLILDAYESGSEQMQLSAIFSMGSSADERWLPLLIDELSNHDPDIRAEAARACGVIGSDEAVPLLAQLAQEEDMEVASAAVLAMGQIGDEIARSILADMADDPEFEALHDMINDAMEESDWGLGELNLFVSTEDDFADDETTTLFSEN